MVELYTGNSFCKKKNISGYPVFPSENEADHISLIMEVLGTPPKNMLEVF